MANIDDGFRIEKLSLDDLALIASHTDDPTVGAGYEAPTGSLLLRTNGVIYRKIGTADVDWRPIDIKNVLYRHNGDTTQTFTALTTLLFNTQVISDSPYTYNAGATTVSTAGWYVVSFEVSYTSTTNSRATSETSLYINGVEYVGSRTYGYHRTIAEGRQTSSSSVRMLLSANDSVSVRGSRSAGTGSIQTVSNACRLNITSI